MVNSLENFALHLGEACIEINDAINIENIFLIKKNSHILCTLVLYFFLKGEIELFLVFIYKAL